MTGYKTLSVAMMVILGLALGGCGGSDYSAGTGTSLSGIVADDPIMWASVTVYGPDGDIVGETVTDGTGEYRINVPTLEHYRVVTFGGTMGDNIPFHGSMESFCEVASAQECDITPLTTLAAHLVERDGFSANVARREACWALGVDPGQKDPFVLAVRNDKSGDNANEEFDVNRIEQLRADILESEDFRTWLTEVIDRVPAPYNHPLQGSASLAGSLKGATATIFFDGQELYDTTTTADGTWSTPGDMKITGPFRVEMTGVSDGVAEVEATLSTYVPYRVAGYDASEHQAMLDNIQVNLLSTITDRYISATGVDYETAQARVAAYFEIQTAPGLIPLDPPPFEFSDIRLLEEAQKLGGINDYIDSLVRRIGGSETEYMGLGRNSFSVVKYGFGTLVGYQLLSGMGAEAAKQAFPYVLNALGSEIFEASIDKSLTEMKQDLTTIKEDINLVKIRLETMQSAFLLATEEIKSQINSLALLNASTAIDTQYNSLVELFNCDADGSNCKRPPQATLDRVVKEIGDANIATELNLISRIVIGEEGLDLTGSLETLVDKLSSQIDFPAYTYVNESQRGERLLQAYLVLERYFGHLLAVQMKGLAVEVNRRNYWDMKEGGSGSDQAFIRNTIEPNLEQQVEAFLVAVENLVAQAADVRTILFANYSMFPQKAVEEIFARADLIAHQLSPGRHPGGLVIRVIGDLQLLEECLVAPLNATHFETPEVVRYARISSSDNGSGVRLYPPKFPSGYNQEYLAWKKSPHHVGVWTFYHNDKIAFARLAYPRQSIPFSDEHLEMAPYVRSYTFPDGLNITAQYTRRDRISGEEMPARGDNEVLFGHGVVFARTLPQFDHGPSGGVVEGGAAYTHKHKSSGKSVSGKIVQSIERVLEYKKHTTAGYSASIEMFLHNGDTLSKELGFSCDVTHEGTTKDFRHAATQTYWDSFHYFNLGIEWRLSTEPLLHLLYRGPIGDLQPGAGGWNRMMEYSGSTGDGSRFGTQTYDRSIKKEFSGKGHSLWEGKQVLTVESRVMKNRVQAWAERKNPISDELSDKGSKVTFTKTLERFEIYPWTTSY